MKLTIIALLTLTALGCAGSIEGYGVEYVSAWGNGRYHCGEDNTGPDCVAGGEISENAVAVVGAVVEGKGE